MTGYEFAERLARVLGQRELEFAEANQILDATKQVSRWSERQAVPLVCYLLGLADVSPSSVDQYIGMVVNQASASGYDSEPWTGLQFAEEISRTLGKSELTSSEAAQILDNVTQASICSERLAVPLACYLCGRANKSPSEIGSSIDEALRLPA